MPHKTESRNEELGLTTLTIEGEKHRAFRTCEGFKKIEQINLIIGKNNSGKSSLLDLVEYATPAFDERAHGRTISRQQIGRNNPVMVLQSLVNPATNTEFDGTRDRIALGHFLQKMPETLSIRWRVKGEAGGNFDFQIIDQDTTEDVSRLVNNRSVDSVVKETAQLLNARLRLPFDSYHTFRLLSDRDVQPAQSDRNALLNSDGKGLVQLLEKYDNVAEVDHQALRTVLADLQAIYGPEGRFTRLDLKQQSGGLWDVVLEESSKGAVPLSKSGSGLKTILLVLAFLHLLPKEAKVPLQKCIFCFEELENNLHPSVQRRLFQFLRDFALREGCRLFLTSHSNTAIDIFSRCEKAQILHVTHDGQTARVETLPPKDLGVLLDDLGFRASDILQCNFVLWVEGPSDRLYIRYGLKQVAPELEEGVHYSILIYGGRLLSHFTYDSDWIDPDAAEELINLSRINRNSAILLDSDRKAAPTDRINDTKERVIKGFEEGGCMTWLTWGREIENYIPETVFAPAVKSVHETPGGIKYGQFDSMVILDEAKTPKKYIDKVKVAKKVCETGDFAWRGDWAEKVSQLAGAIQRANGMTPRV